jgi:hypothetical protein
VYITDSSLEAVEVAKKNMELFFKSLPELDSGSLVPFDIQIERLPDAYVPPEGDVFIISALPATGDSERRFSRFNEMLNRLSQEKRLRGCVVLTNKSNQFKRLSSSEWLAELRMFDGRRELEALNLIVPS